MPVGEASPLAPSTPASEAPTPASLEPIAIPLQDGCRAPSPVPPEFVQEWGESVEQERGCLRITLPPGETYWFDANRGRAPCAGAVVAVTWLVLSPDVAEAVALTGGQGVVEIGRGSRGAGHGYCGYLGIANPTTATLTVDLAYAFLWLRLPPEQVTPTP